MSPIIVALDFTTVNQAIDFAKRLQLYPCRVKVGKALFTRDGVRLVEALHKMGFEVFLDLKYHDIPNTVANACHAAADLGVWMVNVHAMGGRPMLTAAREALAKHTHPPLLIAVTVLTSFTVADLQEIGVSDAPADQVLRLARLAQVCDLDGVVCSPQEIALLRAHVGAAFKLVTPGIRPPDAALDDQKRVMTPAAAWEAGTDYLVMGRPIICAADPLVALQEIEAQLPKKS